MGSRVRAGAALALAAVALAGCSHPTETHIGGVPLLVARQLPPDLRASLLSAAAASHSLPVSDFTGFAPGRTYYARDGVTRHDYAAAELVASSSSLRAQVSTQDDGAYDLFVRPFGGRWRVYADGLGGVQGAVCPVTLPARVVAAWRWAPGTCYPPSG